MDLPESFDAKFVRRENRFVAVCDVEGEQMLVHVPHSGRLTELLRPGAPCRLVVPENLEHRRTDWDLLMARHGKRWVCIDSRYANAVVADALGRGALPTYQPWQQIESEVSVGHHRLDFRLSSGMDRCYIEVKCVTLVEQGIALFPDAPTKRGTEHLERLRELVELGNEAAMLFVVLRNDATELMPHRDHDPAFAEALRAAREAGVMLQAWTVDVHPHRLTLAKKIPVICA